MTYNNYLKEKIINLYLINQRIGKHLIKEQDFDFLNIFFDNKNIVKPNIYFISQLLQDIIQNYKNNIILKNKIGLDFLSTLIYQRSQADIFMQDTPLTQPQITLEQTKELITKYTNVANIFGLKEFYYTLSPQLTPMENYNKALHLLKMTTIELDKLQKTLNLQDSYKLGNGILSVQLNWQEESQNNGYYNYCSNTICLKDENTTFPLIHEYIHFIDKTTTCLLITGKTSQQLYEEKSFSQKELFDNFDMSVFSNIEFDKENFPWISIIKLKLLFKIEIEQNKYIRQVFETFDPKKDYTEEFKTIILSWIDKKQYKNQEGLKNDIHNILENKITNFDNTIYSNEELNLINKALAFNTFDLNMNNFKNWSEEFDSYIKKRYYSTQKETLARTLEQAINGTLAQLSDQLTTPNLLENEKAKFFEIIKSWQNISEVIVNSTSHNSSHSNIWKIREKMEKQPNLINYFKFKK